MNVCFFNDISVLGGGELWALNSVAALTRLGHGTSIVCPHRSALFKAALAQGVDVHGHMLDELTPFYEPLFHFLRSRDVDVVYCTVIGRFCEAEVLGRLVSRLNDERPERPTILLLKTGLPPAPQLGPSYYGFGDASVARRLHVVSEENRQRFLDWVPAADQFVQVAREGVDLGRFHRNGTDPQAARQRLGLPDADRIITCASRLEPHKGQEILLHAAKTMVARDPGVYVVLAGAGRDLDRLTSLRDHLGLANHVRLLGHVEDMPALLTATDIFCHPSLVDGLPNAVVEAMAMGVPVVATAVGGVPEVVRDGRDGLLVAPNDVNQLADRLGMLVDDDALRARLGSAAAAAVRSDMDFSARLARWVESVEHELEAARSRPGIPHSSVPAPRTHPVLILLTHLRTGGEETETAILARYLDRRRYPVSVATAHAAQEPSPARDRLHQLGVVIDEGCHSLSTLDQKADYLARYIRAHGIRIVVACQDTLLAARIFEQLSPSECRLIEHAGIAAEVGRIPKQHTSSLIAVSEAIARAAAPHFADARKVVSLPSMVAAVDYPLAERARFREGYGFGDDIIVVFAGRLDAKKGLHLLIDAAARLLGEVPRVRFVAIGPPDAFQPDYARQLNSRVARELPGGRFIFAGARSDVAQILVAADLFVLPAIGEGMSHVINEAGAAGLPVVAFDDGAAREQVGDDGGILVAAGDTAALSEALRRLATDAALRTRLGTTLRERVLARYDAALVVPQWQALFDRLVPDLAPSTRPPAFRDVPPDHVPPFPFEIQVETNTACNATCIMCPYPEVAREMRTGQMEVRGGRMDLALYEKILDECAAQPGLRRIEPFLNNEPFTDTRMVDWIAMAKRTVPHAALTVTTNGSLVTPKVTDRLIGSGLDAIWFSFNGATKETYESIMGLSFDQVKRNIDYLLDVKPASLRVFTNMIDTVPMSGEIADNIRYWNERGVQSGSSPFVNRAGNVANFDELNYRALSPRPARLCELLYHKMYVGYNGDVLLCCMDWRRRVVLGNVREQSLQEIWNGPHYRHYRTLHEEQRVDELELCGTCSYVHG